MVASEGCCCFWVSKVNELEQAGAARLRTDFIIFFGFIMFSEEGDD